VIGVLWPSIRWADDDQIVGGGLSVGDELATLEAAITERVEDLQVANKLRELAGALDVSAEKRTEFVEQLRGIMPDPGEVDDDDAVPAAFLEGDPEELFEKSAQAETDVVDVDAPEGGVDPGDLPPGIAPDLLAEGEGGAAGLGFGLPDFKRFARRLLNVTSYYTMKERSGKVGKDGLAPLLEKVSEAAGPPRLHLAGHSFGARLVTATAAKTDAPIASMSLLQGAFSARGFSEDAEPPGAFRGVLDGPLVGPGIVTHTHNDKAVLLAYAVASRLAGQASAGIGDANDPYGGLGANGAVATDRVIKDVLADAQHRYTFTKARLHNLRADRFVAHHGDVRNVEVANAVLQAMLSAPDGR
jgi:pimeloyl-ACP methyl ester carboxylesterase